MYFGTYLGDLGLDRIINGREKVALSSFNFSEKNNNKTAR